MSKRVVIGNWKMNKGVAETQSFIRALKKSLPPKLNCIVGVAPPFTSLSAALEIAAASPLKIVAQNVHWDKEGAFTGEISPTMLKEIGCKTVLIGHSERRQYFGETNQAVNKRIKGAIEFGLEVVFCLGEKLSERENGTTKKIIESQLLEGLEGLTSSEVKNLIVAYEPVWAIGTGKNATPVQAQEVHTYIRSILSKKFSPEVSQGIRIIYGGSVKPDNIAQLLEQDDIDGVLVGGASLDVDSFVSLIVKSNET